LGRGGLLGGGGEKNLGERKRSAVDCQRSATELKPKTKPKSKGMKRETGNGGWKDFVTLTKPRLNLVAWLTTAAGFQLASQGPVDMGRLGLTLLGAALVAGGCGALNQWLEVDQDRLMKRTNKRPLPAGRLTGGQAFLFGTTLSAAGVLFLLRFVNPLSALLGFATAVTYLFLYTPLKRLTPICTLLGAIPGALPPAMGWAAARGTLDAGGLALFAFLFLWQMPHFLAIGWIFKDDYAAAGFPMTSVVDPDGTKTGREAVGYSALLIPASLAPTWLGITGHVASGIAVVLGSLYLYLALQMMKKRDLSSAKALFRYSILYLLVMLGAYAMNKVY